MRNSITMILALVSMALIVKANFKPPTKDPIQESVFYGALYANPERLRDSIVDSLVQECSANPDVNESIKSAIWNGSGGHKYAIGYEYSKIVDLPSSPPGYSELESMRNRAVAHDRSVYIGIAQLDIREVERTEDLYAHIADPCLNILKKSITLSHVDDCLEDSQVLCLSSLRPVRDPQEALF